LKDRGYNVFEYDIANTPNAQLLEVLTWIFDEFKLIARMEDEHLNTPPDFKMAAAGVERMNVFGHLNVIDSIAGGDPLKWEAVRKLPYHVIFDKQYKSTIENDIQKKLMEANTKKKG
jgi:hypothetical protein